MNKKTIQLVYSHLKEALSILSGEECGPNEEMLKLTSFLSAAYDSSHILLDDMRIKAPEGFCIPVAEPLSDEEENVHRNLQVILRFDDKLWANVTEAQKFSAARVIARQGGAKAIQHPVAGGGDSYIGISFPHIFIGIEPDGYAHS